MLLTGFLTTILGWLFPPTIALAGVNFLSDVFAFLLGLFTTP